MKSLLNDMTGAMSGIKKATRIGPLNSAQYLPPDGDTS